MKKIGVQLDSNCDLMINVVTDDAGLIVSGLTIGNTLYQNQFLILKPQKGENKEYPMMGAGIDDMLNDNDEDEWKKRIREELARDGLKVSELTFANGEMMLKADY